MAEPALDDENVNENTDKKPVVCELSNPDLPDLPAPQELPKEAVLAKAGKND